MNAIIINFYEGMGILPTAFLRNFKRCFDLENQKFQACIYRIYLYPFFLSVEKAERDIEI